MFLLSEFYYNFTTILAVSIDLHHSYCNIVFLIILFTFLVPNKKFLFLIIVFLRKYYYKRKTTLPNLQERDIKIIYSSLKCTACASDNFSFELYSITDDEN